MATREEEIAGLELSLTESSGSGTFFQGTVQEDLPTTEQILRTLKEEIFGSDEEEQLEKLSEILSDVDLKILFASHDTDTEETNLVFKIGSGEIEFFIHKDTSTEGASSYAIGVRKEFASDLPVVGNSIKSQIGYVYASEKKDYNLPRIANGQLSRKGINTALDKESNLLFNLSFSNDLLFPITVNISNEEPGKSSPTTGSKRKKKTLKKNAGLLFLETLELIYSDDTLSLLITGGGRLSGLALTLEGLGLSLKPFELLNGRDPQISVGLDGIGISYKGGPVEITGAFLKETIDDGPLVFNGAAMLKAKSFLVSGLGSYSSAGSQADSLFVFAMYQGMLGGPPFFTVEGLAAGFGLHRRVNMPEVDKLDRFPFIQMAISPPKLDLADILPQLSGHVEPSPGDYWLAVGVKFNSFQLIDSFALLVASFGDTTDFRLDILGISTMVFPSKKGGSGKPIARLRMAFKATFIPSEGFLGVAANLTEGSYILSKDCKLTGGFAFYSWFEDIADKKIKAGDFVQTMGGYHPNFKKPAHYPNVPRLSFNWRVSKDVTLKGQMYFALTPSMCMAGGRLEAIYKSGPFTAWFIVGADFLISWEPFFYDASFYVTVGARYQEDWGLFDMVIQIEVGCDVHITGPELKGTATIDLDIAKIDIHFGAEDPPNRQFIDWDTFKTSFLPKEDETCGIFIEKGLLRTVKEEGVERWIINPKDLVITTDSVIPSTTDGKPFGIEPMGLKEVDIESSLSISILRGKDAVQDTEFRKERIHKNFPKALWQEAGSHPGNPKLEDTEGTIDGLLAGYRYTPAEPPTPGKTTSIDPANLLLDTSQNENGFSILREVDLDFAESTPVFPPSPDVTSEGIQIMEAFAFDESEFDLTGLSEDSFMNTPKSIQV